MSTFSFSRIFLSRCLSSASIVGLNREERGLDKNFSRLQLDPCKAHNLVIKYRFYSHEEVISKSVEIHEDGFYCQEQKLKEREKEERQRVEKKRKEKERQERIEKERTKQEKEEQERIDREKKENDVLEKKRAEKENREGTTMAQGEEEEETDETTSTTGATTKSEGNRTSMESKSIDNESSEKAQVEVITLIVAFAVLTTTVVLIASFICWQRHQSKKSSPHQVQSDQNHTYGTYARGPDGEGEYGDGDKVYVTDNNFYYGT